MRRSRRSLTRRNPGLKPSNDSETDMTGAHFQEKGLFSGIEKPLTQPLRIRILSARRIKSGFEAAKRQRSGHVVHMTGAHSQEKGLFLGMKKPPTHPS